MVALMSTVGMRVAELSKMKIQLSDPGLLCFGPGFLERVSVWEAGADLGTGARCGGF
jgi:hypothetical protein